MSHSNGIIIILAFPNTVVKPANWELLAKYLPYFGIGNKNAIQAGHAALLLIKKGAPEINYYDFGRYITTFQNGRVRSKRTDPELHIPILAKFKKGELSNLNEILIWIEKHPQKTHGQGKLVASVNDQIDFSKASDFINTLINRKEITYGAFIKNGSNCARFVTEVLKISSIQKKIKAKLKLSNLFTPSPIGNVLNGKNVSKVHQVHLGKITAYKNRSVLKEHKNCFFNKLNTDLTIIGTEKPNKKIFSPKNGTWLGGIGSGAWFVIEEKIAMDTYKISRYCYKGQKDFEGAFQLSESGFEVNSDHHFVHPTNCQEVFIVQENKKFSFKSISI